MQLVMQRIAALYLAIALEGSDAAASLCQTCQGGSVGQPCLGQESRSYNFFGIFLAQIASDSDLFWSFNQTIYFLIIVLSFFVSTDRI